MSYGGQSHSEIPYFYVLAQDHRQPKRTKEKKELAPVLFWAEPIAWLDLLDNFYKLY